MIVFSYEGEEFFIDDDFKVEGGKDKDIFEKDIDIFLMDKTPASGNIVVQYAEHLEKDVGAKVKLVENKKYPKGTVDVSEYEDEPKNNSKDITSILEGAFGAFKNYITSRLENSGEDLIGSLSNEKKENGFITIDAGTEDERVIWVEFAAGSRKSRERIAKILKDFDGETKYDFSHTRAKISEEQQNEIKDTYNDLQKEYDFKPVAQFEVASDVQSGSLGVCCSGNKCSTVSLAPSLYNGTYTQKDWEESVKTGFHPKGTGDMVKSVLMHELGHAITSNADSKEFWNKIDTIRKDYMKNIKKEDVENVDFISNYARVNSHEFVAEAFSQGKLAKTFGKYTRQVMEQIDKHFKKGYQHEMFNSKEEDKKQDADDIWVEGFGMGYPLSEKDYEDMKKKQEKASK